MTPGGVMAKSGPGRLAAGAVSLCALMSLGGTAAQYAAAEPPELRACVPDYVHRLAVPEDDVCVTAGVASLVQDENRTADLRWIPGTYACIPGFVQRLAGRRIGDAVCVTPEREAQTQKED